MKISTTTSGAACLFLLCWPRVARIPGPGTQDKSDRVCVCVCCAGSVSVAKAKMSNLARDKPRAVWRLWIAKHGVVDAAQCVRKIVPRCISGRWNSVTAVENYFLKMGRTPLERMQKYSTVARILFGKEVDGTTGVATKPKPKARAKAGRGRGRGRGRGHT